MSEMTEWFPATIKPARRGWYEVANVPAVHRNSSAFLTGRMRYWDGKQWWGAWFPELTYRWATIFGAHTTHHWRGLARGAEMSENEKRLRDKAAYCQRRFGPTGWMEFELPTLQPPLDTIDALRAQLDAAYAALGGDAYWMDPPDGGSPTLAEMVAKANKAGREADALRAECEAMRALLVPVRGWVEDAGHSPYCNYAGNTTEPCDCGYVAILADIDAAIAAKGE